jgi:hypothetical protein
MFALKVRHHILHIRKELLSFEVLTAVVMKSYIFWDNNAE